MNNSSNVSNFVSPCQIIEDMNSKHPAMVVTQSVVFDLMAAIFATGFAYQFHQRLDISHPIYSILFTNIIFSTVSSYFSFVITSFNVYKQHCILSFLAMLTNSSSLFINIISCLVTAVIRYYLLVTNDQNGDINWFKVKTAALTLNCGLLTSTIATRGVLMSPRFTEFYTLFPVITFDVILKVVLISITLLVYCKMNSDLKDKRMAENLKKRSQKVNEDVTEQCSIDSKPTTYEVDKSEDYGGIYIGDKTSQSVENGSELNTKNLKNTDEERNKIEVIPEALKKSNETNLNIQHNILSLESLTVLPNTVTSEEIITNEFVSSIVVDGTLANKTSLAKNVNLEGSSNINKNKSSDVIISKTYIINRDAMENINSTEASETYDPTQNHIFPQDLEDPTEIILEYENSKEHRSIRKSLLISGIYFAFILIPIIVIQIIYKYENIIKIFVSLYVMFSKLFRTFAVIFTSIYCYELVHVLFCELLSDVKDSIENMYVNIRHFVTLN